MSSVRTCTACARGYVKDGGRVCVYLREHVYIIIYYDGRVRKRVVGEGVGKKEATR